MTIKTTLLLTLLPLLVLSACEFGAPRLSQWEKDQLQSRASNDIDNFVAEFADFGDGVGEAAASRDVVHWEACVVGYAGCQRCYTLDGDGAEGTLSMEHVLGDEVEECAASVTINDVFLGYTIHEWWWDGSYGLRDDGLYDIAWNGNSESTLVIEGSRDNDGTYDYSYVMNEATGVTDGDGDLSEWSVDYAYNGFLDRQFAVTCSKDATGKIVGTITGESVTCEISGQDYDYVVECR